MTNLLAKGALAADVIPPPTLVIDFLYLGIPLGLVAGALLLAAVVAVYRRQRQRGRSRVRAVLFGALTLFAGNLALSSAAANSATATRHSSDTAPGFAGSSSAAVKRQ